MGSIEALCQVATKSVSHDKQVYYYPMTDEKLLAVRIGHRLPAVSVLGLPVEPLPEEYEVIGVPEWIRIQVHRKKQGWYFSTHGTEDRRLPYSYPVPPVVGRFFASQEELLTAIREYLRAADPTSSR